MKDIPDTVTTADFAELVGIGSRQVQRLVNEGVLPQLAYGKFELKPTLAAYLKHKTRRETNVSDLGQARTLLYGERAEKMRLEREALAGRLWNRDEVIDAIVHNILIVRTRMLQIPSKYAPALLGLKSISAISALLTEGVHEALDNLQEIWSIITTTPPGPKGERDVELPHLDITGDEYERQRKQEIENYK
jgi:hypothetical protein